MILFERFEAAKIKRFVQRYSKSYEFKRPDLNVFKEPTGTSSSLCTIKGVYHEASYKYMKENITGAGAHAVNIEPMILCLKNDQSDKIRTDDLVNINGHDMKVTRIKDINNSGFAYDISLELIDNGSQA